MNELPEVINLAKELNEYVKGKRVKKAYPPSSPHKFCWYNSAPEAFSSLLYGKKCTGADGFGMYVELQFDGDVKINISDGINLRLLAPEEPRPKKYQFLVDFEDGYSLSFTVSMYGGIFCYKGFIDNGYYNQSKTKPSPLSDKFNREYFDGLFASVKPEKTAKFFLATEQRIPGLGNGVLQDILFKAGINPRKKLETFTEIEKTDLFYCVKAVLKEMTDKGGRDVEKDIFGKSRGYKTSLSRLTLANGCPHCGEEIVKEAYLGGNVYYCPKCQPKASEPQRKRKTIKTTE